jgi:hypothetical protein
MLTIHKLAYIDYARSSFHWMEERRNGSNIKQTVLRKSQPVPLAEHLQVVDVCQYLLCFSFISAYNIKCRKKSKAIPAPGHGGP